MSGYLYRAYDESGRLIYVGQSTDPVTRRAAHMTGSAWAETIREWRITGPFPGADILRLEAETIRDEKPLMNVRCAVLPPIPRGVRSLDHDPQALRSALKAARLTQRELASRVGIGESLVSEILRGTRNATPAMIARLAEVLEVPPARLEVAA